MFFARCAPPALRSVSVRSAPPSTPMAMRRAAHNSELQNTAQRNAWAHTELRGCAIGSATRQSCERKHHRAARPARVLQVLRLFDHSYQTASSYSHISSSHAPPAERCATRCCQAQRGAPCGLLSSSGARPSPSIACVRERSCEHQGMHWGAAGWGVARARDVISRCGTA